MAYIVDSTLFQAEGALLRWATVARRLGFPRDTKTLPQVLHLRWTLNPELGFPTEPFIVWRRHKDNRKPQQRGAVGAEYFRQRRSVRFERVICVD
jgi:hypothetical protein